MFEDGQDEESGIDAFSDNVHDPEFEQLMEDREGVQCRAIQVGLHDPPAVSLAINMDSSELTTAHASHVPKSHRVINSMKFEKNDIF